MDRPGVVDPEPDPRYEPVEAPGRAELPVPDVVGRRGARLRAGPAALGARRPPAQARGADHRARLPDREVRRAPPQAQGRDDRGVDARLDRGVRVDLGTPVRDRLRPADLRPRARARARAPASGSAGERAAVHPVPRRRDRDEGAPRRRLEGGACRARRSDPRLGGGGGVLDRGRGDGLRAPHGARVRRVLPEPLQPRPDRPARRRPGGRGAPPGLLVRRAADDGRARRPSTRTRSSSSSSCSAGSTCGDAGGSAERPSTTTKAFRRAETARGRSRLPRAGGGARARDVRDLRRARSDDGTAGRSRAASSSRSQETLAADVSLIASEFLAGFQLVHRIDRPAVSIFGSARIAEGHRRTSRRGRRDVRSRRPASRSSRAAGRA